MNVLLAVLVALLGVLLVFSWRFFGHVGGDKRVEVAKRPVVVGVAERDRNPGADEQVDPRLVTRSVARGDAQDLGRPAVDDPHHECPRCRTHLFGDFNTEAAVVDGGTSEKSNSVGLFLADTILAV
jgi:hypothetical protein